MEQDARRVVGYEYGKNSTTEYQRFKSEYFTGADIRIYFGDIWVDEITSLQFTLQEQVAPIYGYASYTWDKVARGARSIQGSFTVNFKESYYLQAVLNSLSSKMKGNSKSTPMFDTKQWKDGVDIEHLISSFDVVADEFEKSFWGEGLLTSQSSKKNKGTYFYPNIGNDGGSEVLSLNQSELADSGFNILIGYGPMNEKDGMKASETAHSLIGVQLTGVSQLIGGDGQPIAEQYTFIAKDLDGNVKLRA
jgi:hypothetical protein